MPKFQIFGLTKKTRNPLRAPNQLESRGHTPPPYRIESTSNFQIPATLPTPPNPHFNPNSLTESNINQSKNPLIDHYQWVESSEVPIPDDVIATQAELKRAGKLEFFKTGFSKTMNMAYFI
jgi:hypothetical protein